MTAACEKCRRQATDTHTRKLRYLKRNDSEGCVTDTEQKFRISTASINHRLPSLSTRILQNTQVYPQSSLFWDHHAERNVLLILLHLVVW